MLPLVYFQENYTAPRMVLAASGVEHEELLSIAEPLLSDIPSVPCPEEPKSVYVGGDYRCQTDLGVHITHDSVPYFCFFFSSSSVSIVCCSYLG